MSMFNEIILHVQQSFVSYYLKCLGEVNKYFPNFCSAHYIAYLTEWLFTFLIVQLSTACLTTSAETLPEDYCGSNIIWPAEKLACVPPGLSSFGNDPAFQPTPDKN